METRTCAKCKEEKGLRDFYQDKRRRVGYQSYCMLCTRRESKLRYYALMRAREGEALCRVTVEMPKRDREALKVIARAECKKIGVVALQGIRELLIEWYAQLNPPTTPDQYLDAAANEAKVQRMRELAEKLHKERGGDRPPSERMQKMLAKMRRKGEESSQNSTS